MDDHLSPAALKVKEYLTDARPDVPAESRFDPEDDAVVIELVACMCERATEEAFAAVGPIPKGKTLYDLPPEWHERLVAWWLRRMTGLNFVKNSSPTEPGSDGVAQDDSGEHYFQVKAGKTARHNADNVRTSMVATGKALGKELQTFSTFYYINYAGFVNKFVPPFGNVAAVQLLDHSVPTSYVLAPHPTGLVHFLRRAADSPIYPNKEIRRAMISRALPHAKDYSRCGLSMARVDNRWPDAHAGAAPRSLDESPRTGVKRLGESSSGAAHKKTRAAREVTPDPPAASHDDMVDAPLAAAPLGAAAIDNASPNEGATDDGPPGDAPRGAATDAAPAGAAAKEVPPPGTPAPEAAPGDEAAAAAVHRCGTCKRILPLSAFRAAVVNLNRNWRWRCKECKSESDKCYRARYRERTHAAGGGAANTHAATSGDFALLLAACGVGGGSGGAASTPAAASDEAAQLVAACGVGGGSGGAASTPAAASDEAAQLVAACGVGGGSGGAASTPAAASDEAAQLVAACDVGGGSGGAASTLAAASGAGARLAAACDVGGNVGGAASTHAATSGAGAQLTATFDAADADPMETDGAAPAPRSAGCAAGAPATLRCRSCMRHLDTATCFAPAVKFSSPLCKACKSNQNRIYKQRRKEAKPKTPARGAASRGEGCGAHRRSNGGGGGGCSGAASATSGGTTNAEAAADQMMEIGGAVAVTAPASAAATSVGAAGAGAGSVVAATTVGAAAAPPTSAGAAAATATAAAVAVADATSVGEATAAAAGAAEFATQPTAAEAAAAGGAAPVPGPAEGAAGAPATLCCRSCKQHLDAATCFTSSIEPSSPLCKACKSDHNRTYRLRRREAKAARTLNDAEQQEEPPVPYATAVAAVAAAPEEGPILGWPAADAPAAVPIWPVADAPLALPGYAQAAPLQALNDVLGTAQAAAAGGGAAPVEFAQVATLVMQVTDRLVDRYNDGFKGMAIELVREVAREFKLTQ